MNQFILTIVFIAGIFVDVFAALFLIYIIKQRLPEHIRVALEQFARQAVWQVEQQNGTLSGASKKELAISAVIKLFQAFGLPVPASIAVDIAIEAAVFVLHRMYTTSVESDNPPKIEAPKTGG